MQRGGQPFWPPHVMPTFVSEARFWLVSTEMSDAARKCLFARSAEERKTVRPEMPPQKERFCGIKRARFPDFATPDRA